MRVWVCVCGCVCVPVIDMGLHFEQYMPQFKHLQHYYTISTFLGHTSVYDIWYYDDLGAEKEVQVQTKGI